MKLVAGPEVQAMLEQIALSVNDIANAWWQVRRRCCRLAWPGLALWRLCHLAGHR